MGCTLHPNSIYFKMGYMWVVYYTFLYLSKLGIFYKMGVQSTKKLICKSQNKNIPGTK